MESFRLAFEELKSDAIEFDVHFSRDQVPVVIHDATLERTTSGRGYISHKTFSELQKLDAGKGFRIPSLEEVLILFKAKTLAVEIKEKSAELVHAVMALIQKHKAADCVVGSKHHLVAQTLEKHYPQQQRFLSQREIVQNFIATGLAPKMIRTGTASQVASMPLEGCGMHFDDPHFLDCLRRKEIKIYFWTINDPKEIQRLAAAGADGIITDDPGAARQALGLRN